MQGQFTFYSMLFFAFTFSSYMVNAQDEGFMYGQVTTIDGDKYEGAIRWGKEEAYWTDMFNAAKVENEYLGFLSRQNRDYLEDKTNDFWFVTTNWINVSWDRHDSDREFVHQFGCQFGEIKRIRPTGRHEAEIVLQDGSHLSVDGNGYNDIGTKVQVIDEELGAIELSWSRIDEVEFRPAPKTLANKFGEPLYGTVLCSAGKFTGFIQWDHDERVSEDKLDGDTEDGNISIKFGSISAIERAGSTRSIVTLKSGRKLTLRGSNDVNSENRGIIVTIAGLGRIDIPWDEFDQVTFTDAPGSGPAYQRFNDQQKLTATVEDLKGERYKGNLVFDLDEAYNYELLQGILDDVEFEIPFRNIQSITPKNYDLSEISLRNAGSFVLEGSQDVSDKNQGLLIFQSDDKPTYIRYKDVKKISF